jgi:5-methylcytosine-specific restriction endonuclease McrA
MSIRTVRSLKRLGDDELVTRLESLIKDDCVFEAELLATIGEVDYRRLYRQRAFSSMFQFAVDELFLSESMAFKRITAARAAREHPLLLKKLARGELHLTGICLLAPHLTAKNLEELAGAATHKSKRAIEKLLAIRFPKDEVPARVRKLPNRASRATLPAATPHKTHPSPTHAPQPVASEESLPFASARPVGQSPVASSDTVPVDCTAAVASRDTSQRDVVAPLSEERYKIQLTVDAAVHAKLQEARELLGYCVRKDDLAAVFSRALDLLVSDLRNKKHGVTKRPRDRRPNGRSDPKQPSRTIPRRVRREVFERDQGQCGYRDSRGRRCQERSGLEYHHRVPYARGGPNTAKNLELRCHSHNALAAEQDYGVHYGVDHSARRRRDTVRESRAVYRLGPRSRASTGTGKSGFGHRSLAVGRIGRADQQLPSQKAYLEVEPANAGILSPLCCAGAHVPDY